MRIHRSKCWSSANKQRLVVAVSVVAVTVFLGSLFFSHYSLVQAASIPQSSYSLTGLSSRVLITYDGTGMPHIQANSESDGYAGLCWAEAHDRLFEMDELRRAGEGRLAEIFGPGPDNSVVQQDELERVLSLVPQAAAHYALANAEVKGDLTACAQGINSFISTAEQKNTLPLEFDDLGYTPERWQPQDSLLIALYIASSLDSNVYLTKIERAIAQGSVGSQVADALITDPPAAPSMFDQAGRLTPLSQFASQSSQTSNMDITDASPLPVTIKQLNFTAFLAESLIDGNRASNDFAVDGALTASGKPLLANDPHLALSTPSLLYLAQMNVKGIFNVEGVTIPGFPAFLSAHTTQIGWALTFGMFDDVDLFSESLRQTTSGKQVLYRNQWIPVQSRQETFQVAGAAPAVINVMTTPHGPILNSALSDLDPLGMLAIQATFSQAVWTIDGFFALPKAENWQAFRADLAEESIGLNFLFADSSGTHGHIGYQEAGLAPQRNNMENTLVPVPGGDGTHEWTRYANFTELASVYNPPSHILVTANNRIVPDNYAPDKSPVYISRYWDLPWRAQRIVTLLLQAGNHITAQNLAKIQLDTQTIQGQPIAADFIAALARVGLPLQDPDAAASLAALKSWDGNANTSSVGAAIYETILALFTRDSVEPLLGASYQLYAKGVFITAQIQATQALLEHPSAPFWGAATDVQAPAARDHAVQQALAEADVLLRETLSSNHAAWVWGALHTLTYNHPLAGVDSRFAIGSFLTGGDSGTVNTGGWFTQIGLLALPPDQLEQAGGAQTAFAQDALANVRLVWVISNPDASLGVLDTGESGDPASPHWSDQASLWRAGKYTSLAFTSHAVFQNASMEAILN